MNDLAIFKNILSKYKIWHLFRKAYKDRVRFSCKIERYDIITFYIPHFIILLQR